MDTEILELKNVIRDRDSEGLLKRYLMRTLIGRVTPMWEFAPNAADRPLERGSVLRSSLGVQETREQYRARRRIERMTERYETELRLRLSWWLPRGQTTATRSRDVGLPHAVTSRLDKITVCDEVRVVKAPRRHVPAVRHGAWGAWRIQAMTSRSGLELHFRYPAVKLPFVGSIQDGAIIMDAEPIDDSGYRVKYTRGAKGATVVLEDGFMFAGTLIKTRDEKKARKIGLAKLLGGGQ